MASMLDQAKGQFSAFKGTVSDTLLSVKQETETKAGTLQGQLKDLISTAPQALDTAARDIKVKADASASSTAETAKGDLNNVAAFFAGIFEKCCAPFTQKKD